MNFMFLFALSVICSEGASVCTSENEITKIQRPTDKDLEQKQSEEEKKLIETVSKKCSNCPLGFKNYKGIVCVLCGSKLIPSEQ